MEKRAAVRLHHYKHLELEYTDLVRTSESELDRNTLSVNVAIMRNYILIGIPLEFDSRAGRNTRWSRPSQRKPLFVRQPMNSSFTATLTVETRDRVSLSRADVFRGSRRDVWTVGLSSIDGREKHPFTKSNSPKCVGGGKEQSRKVSFCIQNTDNKLLKQ